MTKSKAIFGASLALAMLSGAGSAQACISDIMSIYDGAGKLVEQLVVTEADELTNGPNYIYTLKTAVDTAKWGYATVLYDDQQNPNTSYGDIFGVVSINGGYFLGFTSDVEDLPLPYAGDPNFTYLYEESQYSFDATQYLAQDLQRLGYRAEFLSDNSLNRLGELPEPASLALLGLGFATLAFRRLRK